MTEDSHRIAELIARSRRRLGWGEVATRLRPLHYDVHTPLPHFTQSLDGCEVTDTLGRKYIDWNLGGGCAILGYRRREVEDAIVAQLAAGPLSPFTNPVEIEVAEQLVAAIPSAEMVAFGKNGSDGLTAAVRLARAITGRDVILTCGYHGFHDWFMALDPNVRGVPRAMAELVAAFEYNDLASLEALFEKHRVAAVVMEPTKRVEPAPGFLEGVRALCDRMGALLVFDEVVTAFRVDRSSAQALYGVTPDLTCLGKAMGNGMPLSAIAGPRRIMQHFSSVGVGMTYEGETLSLAAARACLAILAHEPVAEHLRRAGEFVRAAFEEEAMRLGIDARLTGHPARQQLVFPEDHLLGLFLTECLHRGLITNGTLLPSYAHDDEALERSAEILRQALRVVAQQRPERAWKLPSEPDVQGWIDSVEWNGDRVTISGWLLVDGKPTDIANVDRPDVAAVLGIEHVRCGFSIESDTPVVTLVASGVPFTIVANRDAPHPLPVAITYGALVGV